MLVCFFFFLGGGQNGPGGSHGFSTFAAAWKDKVFICPQDNKALVDESELPSLVDGSDFDVFFLFGKESTQQLSIL